MTILEDLKSGRLVVVPAAPEQPMLEAGEVALVDVLHGVDYFMPDDGMHRVLSAALTASPDHTTALVALVEGMREQNGALLALREKDCADYVNMAKNAIDNLARALAAEAKVEALREALAPFQGVPPWPVPDARCMVVQVTAGSPYHFLQRDLDRARALKEASE